MRKKKLRHQGYLRHQGSFLTLASEIWNAEGQRDECFSSTQLSCRRSCARRAAQFPSPPHPCPNPPSPPVPLSRNPSPPNPLPIATKPRPSSPNPPPDDALAARSVSLVYLPCRLLLASSTSTARFRLLGLPRIMSWLWACVHRVRRRWSSSDTASSPMMSDRPSSDRPLTYGKGRSATVLASSTALMASHE